MSTGAIREGWVARIRWPENLRTPFHITMTAAAALVLLLLGYEAILSLRSVKYLSALIVVGLVSAIFLILPRKFNFFLYAAGLTMPYYVQVILLDRDRTTLSVSGTSLVIIVMVIIGFANGALDKSRINFEPRITIPFFLFLCACLLSLVNTTDRTISLVSLVQETEMLLIFLVLINAIHDEPNAIIFLRGLYMGFAIQCVIYVMQNMLGYSFDIVGNTRWGGFTDAEAGTVASQRGTFGNAPATAALYFSLMTLSLIGLHLSRRKLSVRLAPGVGMMMGLCCLVLSTKRSPMAGIVLALMVMLVLLLRHDPGALRKLYKVLVGLAIAFLLCLPVFLIRVSADHEAAFEERANLTRVAWNMYHAHPVLGVGFGTYDTVKRSYLPPDWKGWLYTVHTRYLLILAETGAVGFTALIILYLMVLWVAYKGIRRIAPGLRPLQISLVAGIVATYWEQVWDVFDSRQQSYLYWFLAALAVALPRSLPASNAREVA